MYKKNAFGNPDGSRTEITDMMSEFIIFEDKDINTSIDPFLNNMKISVIVGAKGSGKTVYLRRMQAIMKQNMDVYVNEEIEQELPSTDLIVRFGQCFHAEEITEKWVYVWKFAILRSVISNMLKNSEWNQGIVESDREKLLEYENIIFPKYNVPMTIYSEVRNILSIYKTKNLFNEYAEQKEWDELEVIIGNILKTLPPIYFFIDSVDEEYAHAPMYWLRCQEGLFYRVMRLLRKNVYGNKLHVIICIRDNVMASICESEHHARYINEEHVKLLNWNYSTIQYFFENKIECLKDCYFINEGHNKSICNWLGIREIKNIYRDLTEPIMQYVLRHTRLLPRDIVIIGNALAEIKNMKVNTPDLDIQEVIRAKVASCAKIFGDELLQICANQMKNEMPKEIAHREYAKVYTSIIEYHESVARKIKEMLLQLHTDKFSWEELKCLEKQLNRQLGKESKIFDILWQNGGIGYIEEGPNGNIEVFFNSEYPDFLLPQSKKTYILRSCLVDAVGINSSKWDSKPVVGGTVY